MVGGFGFFVGNLIRFCCVVIRISVIFGVKGYGGFRNGRVFLGFTG